jgi:peptide-methionine (R)-S-oxide reductase
MRVLLLLATTLSTHLAGGLSATTRPARRTIARRTALSLAFALPQMAAAKERTAKAGYPLQADWQATLTSGQYFVLRQGGTEPPNTSILVKEKRPGTFVCAGCQTPLFQSDQKFESGTGWPSFALGLEGVETVPSLTSLLLGSELRCAGCGGHLGDVFNDGMLWPDTPAGMSGKRFCIDGAALAFVPADGSPSVLGDGLSQRRYERPADVDLPSWLQPPKVG